MQRNKAIDFSKTAIFFLVVFMAIGLRVFDIALVPPALNWDEVSHGYNAYSILKTGKDEWGKFIPIIFRAYGDYKLPVYIYLTAISEFLFGLNFFAVRFTSIAAGVFTVIFTYLLTRQIFPKKNIVSLISAFLVAVEPWSLFLSRGAFEANLGLAFFTSGVYFYLRGLSKPKNLLVAALLFGLSLWSYNSYRIFTPIFVLILVVANFQKIKTLVVKSKLEVFMVVSVFLIFLIPMLFQLVNVEGKARYSEVAIIDEGAVAQIVEARNNTKLDPLVSQLIYNRPVFFVRRFLINWTSHFTPEYLFLNGGSHYQFSLPNHGLLNLINFPLLLVGFYMLIRLFIKGDKSSFIIFWLILAPIPSSLTREAPHVLRSITMLPLLMIISAVGLSHLIDLGSKVLANKTQLRAIILILFISLEVFYVYNYLTKYLRQYRNEFSWAWQFGYQEVVQYAKNNYMNYDKIIVTKKYGEPHEFFLFYWPWEPATYQTDGSLIRFYQSNWYWVDRFDKFNFVNDWQLPTGNQQSFVLESGENFNCENEKCLLITSPGKHPDSWVKIKVVNFLNGETAFELYEN